MTPTNAVNGESTKAIIELVSDVLARLANCGNQMRLLFASLVFVVSGCSSYMRDTRAVVPRLDHRIQGDKIILKATVANHTKRSLTFVRHPDFAHFRLSAGDPKAVTDKNIVLIHYFPASLGDLETVRPGTSIQFEETFAYQVVSPRLLKITELPASDVSNSFTMRDTFVRAKFSYGFYEYHFPFLGRFFRPGILIGEVEVSKDIKIP